MELASLAQELVEDGAVVVLVSCHKGPGSDRLSRLERTASSVAVVPDFWEAHVSGGGLLVELTSEKPCGLFEGHAKRRVLHWPVQGVVHLLADLLGVEVASIALVELVGLVHLLDGQSVHFDHDSGQLRVVVEPDSMHLHGVLLVAYNRKVDLRV